MTPEEAWARRMADLEDERGPIEVGGTCGQKRDPWLDEPWTEEEQRLLREAEQQEGVLGTMK